MSQDRANPVNDVDIADENMTGMTGGNDEVTEVYHRPVMVDVVVEMMRPIASGVVVDATFGGGGHAKALKQELGNRVEIVGIDRDPAARAQGADSGIRVLAGDFGNLDELLDDADIGRIGGFLFDFGVSSHQLDEPARGFSYRNDGPLDMRMDTESGPTAADLIDEVDVDELTDILSRFGEEQSARRIASAIVAARPIRSTQRLADVVSAAMPAGRRAKKGHPARKTFQALRIAVNNELTSVADGLDQALDRLEPGGRCVAISYHSLEDRIVKRRFARGVAGCVCPPELPVCACGAKPDLHLLTRGATKASDVEIATNPRARSARLRAVEKVGTP